MAATWDLMGTRLSQEFSWVLPRAHGQNYDKGSTSHPELYGKNSFRFAKFLVKILLRFVDVKKALTWGGRTTADPF